MKYVRRNKIYIASYIFSRRNAFIVIQQHQHPEQQQRQQSVKLTRDKCSYTLDNPVVTKSLSFRHNHKNSVTGTHILVLDLDLGFGTWDWDNNQQQQPLVIMGTDKIDRIDFDTGKMID